MSKGTRPDLTGDTQHAWQSDLELQRKPRAQHYHITDRKDSLPVSSQGVKYGLSEKVTDQTNCSDTIPTHLAG